MGPQERLIGSLYIYLRATGGGRASKSFLSSLFSLFSLLSFLFSLFSLLTFCLSSETMCFTMCDLKITQFIDVFLTLTPLKIVFWALRKSKTLKKTLFSDVDLSQTMCFTMSDLKKHQKDYVFLTLTPLTMVFWAKSLPKASPKHPKVVFSFPKLPKTKLMQID